MKALLIFLCLFLTFQLISYGQDKWGFCVAKVNDPKGEVFISDVVNISSLQCSNNGKPSEQENIVACLRDWYYDRLVKQGSPVAKNLTREDIYPEFSTNSTFMKVSLPQPQEVLYMDKKTAVKKRKEFIKMRSDLRGKPSNME